MWSAIDRAAGFASGLAFYVAVLLLVVLTCIGTADVLLTQFLSRPIPGAVELSEAAMAVLVFLGLGQVQRVRGHIVIDLFTQRLPPAASRWLTVLTSSIELCFMAAMGAAAWALAMRSFRLSETATGYLAFPLFPGKALVVAGILLATIELLRQTVWLVAGGDRAGREKGDTA